MTQVCPVCSNEIDDQAPACPYCGFKLLGTTQGFTPIKFNAQGAAAAEVRTHSYDLKIVRGPQTGIDIPLREGSFTVGRDPKCDVFLNDMTVSRLHARIEVSQKGCVITDENSFNGVWVNDRMAETCLLKSGDVIQIGVFCLVFREQG